MFEVEVEMGNDNDSRNTLRVYHNNKIIFEGLDWGEPEDNSFYRDYKWIKGALMDAYKLGYEDGRHSAICKSD